MSTLEQEPVTEPEYKIELTTDSLHSLDTTWRWASFLSVIGFIFIALLVLLGVTMGFIFSFVDVGNVAPFFRYGTMLLYIALGVAYFFPILYLFRFSSWTKKALRNRNSLDLGVALKNLKSHYRYIGIMTIAILGLYLFIIIGFVIFRAIV